MRKIKYLVGLSAVIAGGVAVNAVAHDDGGKAPGTAQDPVASVRPSLGSILGAFDTERTASDSLPPRLSAALAESRTDGLNVALSRRAIVRGDTSGYLIPSERGVCLWLDRPENAVGGCTSTEAVANGASEAGPGTTFREDGRIVVYGVVPDGVRSVDITFDGDETRTVPASSNTYYAELPAGSRPSTLRFEGDAGAVSFDVFVADVAALERQAAAPE